MEVIIEETKQKPWHDYFTYIIAGLGAVLWFLYITETVINQDEVTIIAVIGIVIALLTSFPIRVFGIRLTLNHIIFLGALLTFNTSITAWSVMIGVGLAVIIKTTFSGGKDDDRPSHLIFRAVFSIFYEVGLLILPIVIPVLIFNALGDPVMTWGNFLGPLALPYVLVHSIIILAAMWLQTKIEKPKVKDGLVIFVLMELLPLPFIWISVSNLFSYNLASIGIVGGIQVLFTVLLFEFTRRREILVRRVQDLSLLNEVSEVIRYSADLGKLLEVIHSQTANLLGVKNFYVAIYDQVDKTIWYPLAIKHDETQSWDRRPLMNRLTDRVIQEKQAIMLPRDAHKELDNIGAPLGEEPLYSWLGVPLITPGRTIGCLAVFSLTPDITFAKEDMKLLTTLSGQVSIPLENALTIEQSGRTISRQTKQLNIMETIGRQLSSSLQSDDIFELILDYALEFTHSPKGSLSVSDPLVDAFVAKVHRGYKDDRSEDSITEGIPERAIRTGEPVMVNHLTPDPGKDDPSGERTFSQLTVPIVNKDEVIGIINLESPNLNEYTDNELNFVSQLADQATLAINNAALYEKAQRSLREQATLYMISSRLASYSELESVLNGVAQAFSAALDSYLTGVYLWDASKRCYQCKAMMERAHDNQVELPPTVSGEGWTEIKKQKTATGPLQVSGDQEELAKILRLEKGSQSLIFPLQIADQHIGLVLNHLSGTHRYKESELQFPQAIASQSAIAIQNALLFSDVSKGFDRLETVLNAVGEGVLMVDADGQVTLANKPIEAITNLSFSEITGKNLFDLAADLHKPLGLTQEEVGELSLLSVGQGQIDLTSRHSYAFQERFYERMIAPVWAANDQVLGWVIVVRDITEEEQVSQTRELLTETLVHDLRSPIGAVKTTLDLIEEGLSKTDRDPVTDQSIDIAKRSTDRVLTLINSLLDISQLESGNVDIQSEPLDVDPLISDVIGDLVQQANEDGVILRKGDSKELPRVLIEENLIRRVLINLLDNALKFTPEGGIVTVEAAQEVDGFVTIRVKDTGPGIPEDFREKVFTRFSQVPGLLGRRRGSGLGLTFCRLAIEAHNGRIWVESGVDEAGAILAFTLPAAKADKE